MKIRFLALVLLPIFGILPGLFAQDDDSDSGSDEPEVSPEMQAMKDALEQLELERDTLAAENAIAEARLAQDLAERKAALEREKLELEERKAAAEQRTAALQEEILEEMAQLRADLERANLQSQISKAEMDQTVNALRAEEETIKASISRLKYEIQGQTQQAERDQYADQKPVRLEEPLQGSTLIISDRRILLNGVISSKTADYLGERINFYNNASTEYPIFIVIEDSPGGSVMAGYRILKAMESSEAPVYVVVKSYAASMAAVITALADRSFAYPNAILLQHQLAGFFGGNLQEQKEELEETKEWWVRLAKPVADKMGVSLEEFVEQMYASESSGDWDEFADDAVALNWVDVVVEEIRETSLTVNPDAKQSASSTEKSTFVNGEPVESVDPYSLHYTTDNSGRPICILPRINSRDRWWLHNPDGFYQMR